MILKILKLVKMIIVNRKEFLQVKKFLGIPSINFWAYVAAITFNSKFYRHWEKTIEQAQKMSASKSDFVLAGWLDFLACYMIYIAIRHIKPKIVVETGLAAGGSSSFILQAMEDNKIGKLYSIDLPGDNDAIVYPKVFGRKFNIYYVPEGLRPGWLIPPWLSNRHEIILGDSRQELPKLLKKIDKIDAFFHDSLHTDEHVLMEFNTVFPHLNTRSLLLCDDVNEEWTLSFLRFCESKKIPHIIVNQRLGIAIYKA